MYTPPISLSASEQQLINERPLSTITNLLKAFPAQCSLIEMGKNNRSIPIGIEIEVTWRSYFPDLWVENFPYATPKVMERITEECKRREALLLPKLVKATECGIPSGADKYWEFAFDPVTDVAILINQVHILQENYLLPARDKHALHITIGGMRPSAHAYFIAMILEAYACDGKRILTGMDTYGLINLSKGWARKGRAGLFEKQGDHDMQHGFEYGTEFRLLYTPPTLTQLHYLLDRAQFLSEVSLDYHHPLHGDWIKLVIELRRILWGLNLPDCNWGRPHENRELWERVAENFPVLAALTKDAFERSSLS